jgi:hypothetical protein
MVKKVMTKDREKRNENHSDLAMNGNSVERTGGMVSPTNVFLLRFHIEKFNVHVIS